MFREFVLLILSPLFVSMASPEALVVPSAKSHLAPVFSSIANLGAFLLQVRFVAPWTAWVEPSTLELEAISSAADMVAEEIRTINLAIRHLSLARETNRAWLRTHAPGHPSLGETNNTNNGWGT